MICTIKNNDFKAEYRARRRARELKEVLVLIKTRSVYATIEWDASFLLSDQRRTLAQHLDLLRDDLDGYCSYYATAKSEWSANEHGLVTYIPSDAAETLADEIEALIVDIAKGRHTGAVIFSGTETIDAADTTPVNPMPESPS